MCENKRERKHEDGDSKSVMGSMSENLAFAIAASLMRYGL